MPTGGQLGSGVRIFYSPTTTSPQSWTEVPQVMGEPVVPAIERDRVETTVHGVTSLRTYIPGLGDVRDAEFTCLANLSSGSVHLSLRAFAQQQNEMWWRFEIPIDSTLSSTQYVVTECTGRVASGLPNTPIDDVKTIDFTVQVSGNFSEYEAPQSTVGS